MPLSEEEQRLLEQMEQALADEDPKFASTLRGSTLRARLRRTVLVSAIGFVAGVAVLMFGLVLVQTWVSVIGFVLMLAAAYFFVTAWRRGGEVSADETPAPGSGNGRQQRASAGPRQSSFMDRMEERWRRRRDDGL